jgi:predicted transcriptional regulator of viral defense system
MPVERHLRIDIHGGRDARSIDAAIGALASRQHGVVARSQLVAAGIGRGAIDHRLALRRLLPVHRGVFAVGHTASSRYGAWMAAVLAAGTGAVLSHRSAAALWRISDKVPATIDVIAPRHRRSRPPLVVHRIRLESDEVTVVRGIPVTTPARTLLDLTAVLEPRQLERAITEAEVQRLTSPTSIDALIERHPNRRGTAALRRIVAKRHEIGKTVTRSELEAAFLAFVEDHGLPRPRTNTRIHVPGGLVVDAAWPDERLVVELDSYGIHTTRRNFEDDRARDRALTVAGWRTVRVTWRQLHADAPALAVALRTLLGGEHA